LYHPKAYTVQKLQKISFKEAVA